MKKEDKTIVISSLINPKKELEVAQIAVAIAREAQKMDLISLAIWHLILPS